MRTLIFLTLAIAILGCARTNNPLTPRYTVAELTPIYLKISSMNNPNGSLAVGTLSNISGFDLVSVVVAYQGAADSLTVSPSGFTQAMQYYFEGKESTVKIIFIHLRSPDYIAVRMWGFTHN